jgi:hypothetical protein
MYELITCREKCRSPPGEVALSCNLSYWEASIGDGYEQLLLNQPWETWHSGRIILSYQLDSDFPGTWHSRILDHQDDAHCSPPSVDILPDGSRVQATRCARRHCSQTQSSHCNTVSLKWINSIKKRTYHQTRVGSVIRKAFIPDRGGKKDRISNPNPQRLFEVNAFGPENCEYNRLFPFFHLAYTVCCENDVKQQATCLKTKWQTLTLSLNRSADQLYLVHHFQTMVVLTNWQHLCLGCVGAKLKNIFTLVQ